MMSPSDTAHLAFERAGTGTCLVGVPVDHEANVSTVYIAVKLSISIIMQIGARGQIYHSVYPS